MDVAPGVSEIIASHEAAGSHFEAGGLRSYVRTDGEGEPVVLVHGLPASSFLYRKVLPELAAHGLQGVAFDLPGLGLAQRPTDFDYSIPGLGAWACQALDALGLDRFHLAVHDAGGPVGFEIARADPERVRSLTIFDTVLDVGSAPFPGELLAKVTDHVPAPLLTPRLWRRMLLRVGIADRSGISDEEIDAWRVLALREDDGAAYLQIMRRLRSGRDPNRYLPVVDSRRAPYPVDLAWAGQDPILTLRRRGLALLAATGLPWLKVLPGKHYLQEDQAPAVSVAMRKSPLAARCRSPLVAR